MDGEGAIRAYVLIQTHVGRTGSVVDEVRRIPRVTSADSVGGPYDIVALVVSSSLDELKRSVLVPIQGVEGVTRTVTCPVLRM